MVRHERASVKADMWSYGILVWELISDQDITNLQPLAIAQAMQVETSCSPSQSVWSCLQTLPLLFCFSESKDMYRLHIASFKLVQKLFGLQAEASCFCRLALLSHYSYQ